VNSLWGIDCDYELLLTAATNTAFGVTKVPAVVPRVGVTSVSQVPQGNRSVKSRHIELLSIAKVPPFPPDGYLYVIPHLCALIVPVS